MSISMQKETAPCFRNEAVIYVGDDLLSHTLSRTVQSALRGLTSVFGMGTGGTPAVRSPQSHPRFARSCWLLALGLWLQHVRGTDLFPEPRDKAKYQWPSTNS